MSKLAELLAAFPAAPAHFDKRDALDPKQSARVRAMRALESVAAYMHHSRTEEGIEADIAQGPKGYDATLDDALADLLCDLRHFTDGWGLDFDNIVERSAGLHQQEVVEVEP